MCVSVPTLLTQNLSFVLLPEITARLTQDVLLCMRRLIYFFAFYFFIVLI